MSSVTRPHLIRSDHPHASAGLARPPIAAYQRLATRVIHQALRDLDSGSMSDRETARTFLSGSPMLHFWCQLAQLNAGNVVAHMASGIPAAIVRGEGLA